MKSNTGTTSIGDGWRSFRTTVSLLLVFGARLNTAVTANLLTNPGFESGDPGWALVNTIRAGGVSAVITNPAAAHSGNNYISNYNSGGPRRHLHELLGSPFRQQRRCILRR